MIKKCVVLVLCLVKLISSEEACIVPNGERGQCVNASGCPGYQELWEQEEDLSRDLLKFLHLVQCGYEENEPGVCCPASGRFSNTTVTIPSKSPAIRAPYQQSDIADRASGSNILPALDQCGMQYHLPNSIADGMITSIDEFPWMALLQYSNKGASCGGVLISKKYVMSAGHCLTGPLLAKLGQLTNVRLGEYDITSERDCESHGGQCADAPQDINIQSVVVHPEFNPTDKSLRNDIGLIKLVQEATFNYYVQPICLPTPEYKDVDKKSDSKLYVAGWGLTEKNTPSPIKLKLKVPAVPPNKCQNEYSKLEIQLTSKQLCAGGEQRKGTCSGDSGGPLMIYDRVADSWFSVGIVSLGLKKYGRVGVPGVYTKVHDYMDWIRANVKD